MDNSSNFHRFHLTLFLFLVGFTQNPGVPACAAFHIDWATQGGGDDIIDLSAIEPPSDYIPKSVSNGRNLKNPSQLLNRDEDLEQDWKVIAFTNDLLNSISKRTSYANTIEEIRRHEHEEAMNEIKGESGFMSKRNELEQHSGGCEAKKMWVSLGSDHFPRFLKSYNCTSDTCDRNLGECRPKNYSVKILRMNSPENIPLLDEGCDSHLPEKLRCDWKLISRNVTTYCECFSGITPYGHSI